MSWNKCSQLSLKARSHDPGLHDCASVSLAKLRRPAVVRSQETFMPADEDHRMTIDRDADEEALIGGLPIDDKRTPSLRNSRHHPPARGRLQ
jgi:hypothetical protein